MASGAATASRNLFYPMTFDLQKIYESNEAFRCNPAARPIAEKLQMLAEKCCWKICSRYKSKYRGDLH
jgi:hypothetical protein